MGAQISNRIGPTVLPLVKALRRPGRTPRESLRCIINLSRSQRQIRFLRILLRLTLGIAWPVQR